MRHVVVRVVSAVPGTATPTGSTFDVGARARAVRVRLLLSHVSRKASVRRYNAMLLVYVQCTRTREKALFARSPPPYRRLRAS